MGLHLPSALVGSLVAGSGFLLIHRELSHRRRMTTKWALQEYAEDQWREWRKGTADPIADAAKKNVTSLAPSVNVGSTADITSTWNRGVASVRDMLKRE
ncbi:hypothetical protein ACHAXT_008439 [Thalassiosira profunda]